MARPRILTATGDAKLSTAQYKFGSASGIFDGTGDKVSVDATSDISNLSDFTIETWVRCGSNTAQFNNVICQAGSTGAYTTTGYWSLRTRFNNIEQVAMTIKHAGGWHDLTTGFAVNDNTWHHIAAVRSGSTISIYVDGVLKGSGTQSVALGVSTEPVVIGNIGGPASGEGGYTGYVDEVRISNTARYTSAFTPSTSQFVNDANTLLLVHANGTNNSTVFLDDAGSFAELISSFSMSANIAYLEDEYYIEDGYFTPNGYFIREIVGESALSSQASLSCDAELIPGGEIVEASGSWTSSSDFSATVIRIKESSSDLSSQFNQYSIISKFINGVSSLSSSVSLSCDAERIVPATEVSATLTSEFAQSTSADKLAGVTVALASEFTQSVDIAKIISGDSDISSEFTQSADVSKVTGYSVSVSSEATVTATGYKIIEFAIDAGALFSPSFEVNVIVNPFSTIDSIFTFSALPVANRSTSITLDTIGDLNAQAVKTVEITSTLSSQADISAIGKLTKDFNSALSTSASISVDALNVQFGEAALSSSAQLIASGNISNKRPRQYTIVGTPEISTAIKKFGVGSLRPNSAGFNMYIPDSADWTSTVGTIDFWFYKTGTGSVTLLQQSASGYLYTIGVYTNQLLIQKIDSVTRINWNNNTFFNNTTDLNSWIHIRICDDGTALTVWKNGSKVTPGSGYVYVAGSYNAAAPMYLFTSNAGTNFYFDELLITGEVLTAKTVTNFTPPTTRWYPTDQSQIKLLSHYDTDYSDDMGLLKSASAALTSTSTQAAIGDRQLGPITSALSTVLTLSAEVESFINISAALTSSATLTAQAGYLQDITSNQSAEVTVTSDITRNRDFAAGINSLFQLTAEGLDIDFAEASLSATTTISAVINATRGGNSTMSANGFVVAVIGELQSDVANLVSTSSISISAQKLKVTTVALTATSDLSIMPVRYPYRPNGYNDGDIEPIIGYGYWDVLGVKDIKVPAFGTYETGIKTLFTFGPYSLTATKSGTFPSFTNTFTFAGVSQSTTSFDVDRYVWLYIRRGDSTLLGNMDASSYANLQTKTLGTIDFDASSAHIYCLGGTETDLMIARDGYMDGLSEPYYHAFGWIEYGQDWWTANRPAGYNITGVPWKFKDQEQVLGLYNTYGSLDDISSYILVSPVTWTSTATQVTVVGKRAVGVSSQTVEASIDITANYQIDNTARLIATATISCSGNRVRYGTGSESSEFNLTADNVRTRDNTVELTTEFTQVTDNSRTRDNSISTDAIATQLSVVAKNATGTILLESQSNLTANVNAIKDQPFTMSVVATQTVDAVKTVVVDSQCDSQVTLIADGFKSQEGFINYNSQFIVLALTEDSKRIDGGAVMVGSCHQVIDAGKRVNPLTALIADFNESVSASRTREGASQANSQASLTGEIKRYRDYSAQLQANGFQLTVGDVINIDPFLTLKVKQETRLIQVTQETRGIVVEQETRLNIIQGYFIEGY